MKGYVDMNSIVNAYNAALSGWVILLVGVFGEYWYLFAAFLFFNVADWLTGWYKARKLQQESSVIGLQRRRCDTGIRKGREQRLCYHWCNGTGFGRVY